MEEVKNNVYRVITFNTQRNERLEQLKVDLKDLLLSNIKENKRLLIWLQEVSEEIYIYLSNICNKLGLFLFRSWENVSIFSQQLIISENEDILLPWNRKFQSINVWTKKDDILFLNWDFQHWFDLSKVALRLEQFEYLLLILKMYNKAIVTLDTNFVLPREMWEREGVLLNNNFWYSEQETTYDIWRLETTTLTHVIGKSILSIVKAEVELDKIFVKWCTIANQWIYKKIVSSDHYPLFIEIS